MRLLRNQLAPALSLSLALALAACNALNGAGDLSIGTPCEDCEQVEGGTGVPEASLPEAASIDAPVADTAVEGPGGTLDTTFGTGGIAMLGNVIDPQAVAVRADGRILIAGAFSGDLAAVALTSAGAIDATFGSAGRIVQGSGNSSIGNAVAFDSKGRGFIVGSSLVVGSTTSTRYAYGVRVGETQLDPTFGQGGSLRGGLGGQDARGIVITQGDGAVIAITSSGDYVFARAVENGDFDTTFGAGGLTTVDNVGGTVAGIIARGDGFVAGGNGTAQMSPGNGLALAAVKVSLAGVPVMTFGTAAKATSKLGPTNSESGRSIAAQPDDKILLAGDFDPSSPTAKRVAGVTRLTSTGQVDTSYGTAGKVVIDRGDITVARDAQTTNQGLYVDTKGRALVIGNVFERMLAGGADRGRPYVTRLRADGTPDPLFGTQGTLFITIPQAGARVFSRGGALQADGKLVLVGVDQSSNETFVVRIITSTTL